MAIRVRNGRKKPFVVYWVNPSTKKIESKAVETRQEAEKLNAFVSYQLKYERENFQPAEPEPASVCVNTLESVFYLYLRDRNFTQDNLEKTLLAIKPIIAKYGGTEIGSIDKKILLEMQKFWLLSGNKGATVRRKVCIIKAMLNYAFKNGILEALPAFPESPNSESKRYVPPSTEEITRIYEAASPHLKRVIILGFMFGLRVGPCELLKLRWTDVNLEHEVIRVPNAKKGLNEPWRDVPIKKSLLPLLQKWRDEDREQKLEFVITYKGKQVRQIKTAWHNALAKAGITRHIRPYDLRHGFATEAIASGADYGTVAALMGHRSPLMVLRHYQHVKNNQKVLVMENLPELHFSKAPICP